MKPQKQPSKPSHQDLFQIELDRIINEAHPLVKLSTQMGRQSLDEHFGACFCEEGRPAINTRFMVSLHYLKYANNLSDEETLALWVENAYLQIACVDLSRSAHPCLWLITWDPTESTATRPLAIQKDGTWYCYGHDLTKNVCEVFGSAGNIRTVYSYTPYGEVTAEGNVSQPIQWSSEFYDAELGLVYYNYRHYNPADGRWINRDPIAEQGGWNLYCFLNNQFAGTDYFGLKDDEKDKEFLGYVYDTSLTGVDIYVCELTGLKINNKILNNTVKNSIDLFKKANHSNQAASSIRYAKDFNTKVSKLYKVNADTKLPGVKISAISDIIDFVYIAKNEKIEYQKFYEVATRYQNQKKKTYSTCLELCMSMSEYAKVFFKK